MPDLVSQLLEKRGVISAEERERFLNPDYERDTHSPFLLRGMDHAVSRLLSAVEKNERIAVYADYDCDGIPGAALLSDFFKKVGHGNIEVYLPHRDREGYGFHTEAITTLAERGVKLVITVDVGTNAVDAVAYAKELGIDVIVTDHHEPMREPSASHGSGITSMLKIAVAVLNPKLGAYPFRELCGAATAFKLVQAVLRQAQDQRIAAFAAIPLGWEKWLLDMVAMATIADMVPLVGENRVLAHYGLKVLRKSQRRGIDALCGLLRLRKSELTEDDIGFSLAPRINAASRMDTPELALQLLTTDDAAEAERIAAQLEKLNTSRKAKVAGMVKEARAHARTRFSEGERVIVLGNPEWKPALLGLAANSLMNDRGGVVCLWGRDANGKIKGSCRAEGVSLTELFANAGDVFEEAGGHKASGGFTVSHERVHTLHEALAAASEKIASAPSEVGAREHDFLITLPEVSSALFQEVSRLAPFGAGNPKPVFLVRDAIVTGMQRFGKEKAHLELSLECKKSGYRCRAFDFFRSPEDCTHVPAQGAEASVLATIERDTYRGGLSLRIVDVVHASGSATL